MQVRILVGQLLPLYFGPHHKRIHRPSYPLLLQGFLLLLVTMVIVVMVMVTGMNPNFKAGGITTYIHLSSRRKMMLIALMVKRCRGSDHVSRTSHQRPIAQPVTLVTGSHSMI